MRVVVALDSFKGSLTSSQANDAAREGVLEAVPDARVTVVPVADGGEGTVAALAGVGRRGVTTASDLLGRPVDAPHVKMADAAVIESASTVGLPLLGTPSTALARRAHSHGLGLHARAVAAATGARQLLIGLGGTGTTDGGVGMLRALGARIWLADGSELWPDGEPTPRNPLLDRPVRVELPEVGVSLTGLADVSSPLLGSTGAARMFGPQKGADASLVEELEIAMTGWAVALAEAGADVAATPGAGAAGGLGAAVLALGGSLEPGCERLIAEAQMTGVFAVADLVITGEGALDAQSAHGKVPAAIARLARRAGAKRVVALAGRLDADLASVAAMGLDDAAGIHDTEMPLARAMDPTVASSAIRRAAAALTRAVTSPG